MKLLSVKKSKKLYFTISYSFGTSNYKREFSLCKQAFISFLGFPLYSTKTIMVRPHVSDLRDVSDS
jgi:hypothetical protein